MNYVCTMFLQHQLMKLGPVMQDTYKFEKVIEYHEASSTSVPEYKAHWLRYSLDDDQGMDAKDISIQILQDFWTKGNLENTFKRCRTNNGQLGIY